MEKQLILFKDDSLELEVIISPNEDTVWLSLNQLSELFEKNKSTISRHIKNILETNELDISTVAKSATVQKELNSKTGYYRQVEREITYYNLDMIISLGYKVNSAKGILFRKWANRILKEYLISGYTINKQRILLNEQNYSEFNTTVRMIANMVQRKELTIEESKGLLEVIGNYSYALEILDKYDHQTLEINNITYDTKDNLMTYEYAIKEIRRLPDYDKSDLFGKEKDKSFEGAINAIYQTAFGIDVYPSIEEKAANLLYFIVKDHAFYDGNKRIAASIFLLFLDINNILYKEDGKRKIEENALVAIVLMIALSKPEEKDMIVKMIVNLINNNNI